MLTLTKDRKVTNDVTPSGAAAIENSIGVPAGISCPGMSDYCEGICYARKLERVFTGVSAAVIRNWELLKDADESATYSLLFEAIDRFYTKTVKRDAAPIFRIHWDGDFFNLTYVNAWINIIQYFDGIQFWVYTRNVEAAVALNNAALPNLSLYFSADPTNWTIAKALYNTYGIRYATVADTFADAQAISMDISGKPAGKCPEQMGRVPLISPEGSACATCGLCVWNKANISFSKTKR